MEIKVAEKKILRGLILYLIDLTEPLGAGTEVITKAIREEGFKVNKKEVESHCYYLKKKNLIEIEEVKNEVLKIERKICHINSRGIDLLEGTISEIGIEVVDLYE